MTLMDSVITQQTSCNTNNSLYREHRTHSDELIDSPNSSTILHDTNVNNIVIDISMNNGSTNPSHTAVDIPRSSTTQLNNSYSTDSINSTSSTIDGIPSERIDKPVVIRDGDGPAEPKLPRKQIRSSNQANDDKKQPLRDHKLKYDKSLAYAALPPLKSYKPSSSNNNNSLSLYKQSDTITAPSRTDSIQSCAQIIYNKLIQRNQNTVYDITFDIDQYITAEYNIIIPYTSTSIPYTHYSQSLKQVKLPSQPSIQQICKLISKLFHRAKLNTESVIISLIYIERLCQLRSIQLCDRNWLPIVITSLLTASKVWDDISVYNAEFQHILSIFTIKQLNQMERNFLSGIQYNLYINSSEYAQLYFQLRSMRRESDINKNRLTISNQQRNKSDHKLSSYHSVPATAYQQ